MPRPIFTTVSRPSKHNCQRGVLVSDSPSESINSQYLEVYMYYAAKERAREAADTRPIPGMSPCNVALAHI